ncbi:MAG: hypothetical protein IPN22_14435 [Bacteroidetes bacterium]|nr:hypothetical protein [Bacteroidota bacterium]
MKPISASLFSFHRTAVMGVVLFAIGLVFCSFSFIVSVPEKADLIAVDNFSNFYLVADKKIQKYNPDGKYLFPYEEFRYGKIGAVDVSNPMKILVFYPDFSTVVTLDKFLSPLTTYNFFTMGYQNITAVASSIDGRVWFYDNVDFKLKKIDESGKVFRESQPVNVLLEEALNPNFILERDTKVYVNDPEIGVLVFDMYGSYSKTIPLKGLKKFQVLQDQIVFFDDAHLKSYNTFTLETKSLTLPDTSDVKLAVIEKDRLGILKTDKADFYRY